MITPEEIRGKALKFWSSQRLLRAHLDGVELFPLEIPIPRMGAKDFASDFQGLRESLLRLRQGAKDAIGFGYQVRYQRVTHRRLGAQSLPERVVIESLADFLRLTGKEEEFRRFSETVAIILEARPEVRPFLIRRPSAALSSQADWAGLLSACKYFEEHPKPGVYLRQLEIPGVHTKFIETRKSLLGELLELILPPGSKVDGEGRGDHAFERRFGLRVEPPLVRFRLLDATQALRGLRDLTVVLPELAQLSPQVQRVFIVENKTNGLCFPDCPEALVIFGLGYGAACLADVPWLRKTDLYYWGDIDTHGFAILDQLRATFPDIRSLLMDEATLMRSRDLWVREEPTQRFTKGLFRLSPAEVRLFEALRDDRWANSVRLEQERIDFGLVRNAVAGLAAAAP